MTIVFISIPFLWKMLQNTSNISFAKIYKNRERKKKVWEKRKKKRKKGREG